MGDLYSTESLYKRVIDICAIVKDCEAVRKCLLGSKEKEEDKKWTLIGQSYGGFVAIHYISS